MDGIVDEPGVAGRPRGRLAGALDEEASRAPPGVKNEKFLGWAVAFMAVIVVLIIIILFLALYRHTPPTREGCTFKGWLNNHCPTDW
jgi:hypothetical protein